MSGLIFHVPHASSSFPPGERERLILKDDELAAELLQRTAAATDRLFLPAMGDCDLAVVFPWSRLFVDVERFMIELRRDLYMDELSGKLGGID